MPYRLFVNHCHVFPEGGKPGGQIEKLKLLMEECSIEKAVCFTCFKDQYEKSGKSGEPNEWLARKIENDSSLVGFGTVDFDADDIAAQIERMVSYGFKGIKIHPAAQEINIMGDKARQVYEVCEEKGLFISFHTGIHWHRIADYNVLLFDEVAWHYPRLKFSMEHIGGYHFFRDALAVMCNNKRAAEFNTVFAGWTSIAPDENGLCGPWSITDEELRTVIFQTGEERSILGLDFPYNDTAGVKKSIERVMSLDIPESAKEGILGKNLAKALNIEF